MERETFLFCYHDPFEFWLRNWGALGCGFYRRSENVEFVEFMTDFNNRVGELNLDIVPLYKTSIP